MSGTECGMLEKKQEGRFFMYIGNHLSSAKGYEAMGKQAVRLGGETFAFFTRNPRGGKAKEIKPEDVEKFLEIAKEQHFGKIVAHAPYTMNACAAKEDIRELAHTMFTDDLKRMGVYTGKLLQFSSGFPCRTGNGDRDHIDRRTAQSGVISGADDDRLIRDHGGQRK